MLSKILIMKKLILSLFTLFIALSSTAQTWTTSAPNIYYNGGHVGIGTTSPGRELHINSSTGSQIKLESTSAGNWSGLEWSAKNGIYNGYSGILDNDGRYFIDVASNGEDFTILQNGNIGIGTTTPEDKLQVVSANYNDIFSISRNAGAGNENTFDFRITANPNGGSVLNNRSLTILPTQYAADIALLADPTLTQPQFVVKANGRVGIGTTSPTEKLEVNGTIRSQKVKVEATGWPDFVFASNYKLRTLNELEAFIKANQHLPEVPSAKEVEENGLDLGKMDATLLQKVEELTLYLIEQDKNQKTLESKNSNLKTQISKTEKENQELKTTLQEVLKRIEKLESAGMSPPGRTSGAKTNNN